MCIATRLLSSVHLNQVIVKVQICYRKSLANTVEVVIGTYILVNETPKNLMKEFYVINNVV